MEITCNRAALAEAVQLASSIVPARTPKPILQCAKITADKEAKRLTVVATDGDITIRQVVTQVQIAQDGSAVVPADRMAAILREGGDETVDIRVSEATCEVVGQNSRFHIYGHDPDDFPEVELPEQQPCLEMTGGVLKRLGQLSVFAAARETSRYAINGVLWEQHGKKVSLVATDGRRLAKVEGALGAVKKEMEQAAIVPVKTMVLLERIVADPDDKIEVSFSKNQVAVKTAVVEVLSNLVQGRFPKYADVIPTGADRFAEIACEPLNLALRRVSLLTNEQSKGVRLAFSAGKLRLFSSAPEAGDAEVTIDAKYDAEPIEIGFNPQYILEMLRVIDAEEVQCELSDANKPGLLRVGKDFLYVVMPVTG